jgi:hypothetical protein
MRAPKTIKENMFDVEIWDIFSLAAMRGLGRCKAVAWCE